MGRSSLGTYYDALTRWTALARTVGYGGGYSTLTVHRALTDPKDGGRATVTRIHDLLCEHLPTQRSARVLDAGCGLGGTLLTLVADRGGTGVGLTLSDRQAAVARRAALRLSLADRITIEVRSYDQPPAGPFDLVVAIESLAHSPDPAVSVAALSRCLAPGGVLAIVDDMPLPVAGAHAATLETFKAGWACPVLWPVDRYREAFREHGLALRTDLDLSASIQSRGAATIRWLLALNRLAGVVPHRQWRQLMASYRGGLALERLYQARAMQYRLLIAVNA